MCVKIRIIFDYFARKNKYVILFTIINNSDFYVRKNTSFFDFSAHKNQKKIFFTQKVSFKRKIFAQKVSLQRKILPKKFLYKEISSLYEKYDYFCNRKLHIKNFKNYENS